MTATVIDLRDRMDRAADRTRLTIRKLRDYRGLRTDQSIADLMGMGRTKVNNLQVGAVKLTVEAIAAFAAALEVPDYVLSMEYDDAIRWVQDNAPNGPTDGGTTSDQGNIHSAQKANSTGHGAVFSFPSAAAA